MNSIQDQYGFDVTFVSDVPGYLRCVVCHLVLRKPIQIMKCGHRFCDPCFKRMKSYSENSNIALVCPIDRDIIDLQKVFEDNGINRVIGDLVVKCVNDVRGCTWTGDLRDLEVDAEQCKHKVVREFINNQPMVQDVDGSSNLLKELSDRMWKCEDRLTEKEKDLAFLKYSLQELRNRFDEKSVEVDFMKNENKRMEDEVETLKNQNLELKQIEIKMENMSYKYSALERRVESLENELLLSKKEIESSKLEVATVKIEVADGLKKSQSAPNELLKELESKINEEVKKLQGTLDKSLSKRSDATNKLSYQAITNDNEKLLKCLQKKLDDLKYNVMNIENVVFCNLSGGFKDIVLHWKMQNYQHHRDIGIAVYSPMFFTELNGYRFKLRARWHGNKKNLYLGLKLCRGSEYTKVLPLFNNPYCLELEDKDGNILSKTVALDVIREEDREACFTIHPGESESRDPYGIFNFVEMSSLQNYIVNDTLSIRCRLTPP